MKQSFLFLIFAMVFILSGCGFTTENFDKLVKEVSNNKQLSEYLVSIDYTLIEQSESGAEEEYYWYDITGELKDNFDTLSKAEQYKFLTEIVNIVQKNGGTPESGEFYCGENISCEIGHVDLKTSKHVYGVEYYSDYTPSLLFIDDEIVYDSEAKDGVYVDPLSKDKDTPPQNHVNWNLNTADGSDWVGYDRGQKLLMVNDAFKIIEDSGVTVDPDSDWFIEALDAYYSDGQSEQTDDRIIDILTMSGIAGGLIKDK